MTIVTLSAAGRRDADDTWDRYADIGRWREWAPQLSRVEADADRLAYGVTGRVRGPFGALSADFLVDQVDAEAMRWSWTVRRWSLVVRMEHTVTRRGGGSATALRIDGPLPVVVGYAPVAQVALYRLVAGPAPAQQAQAGGQTGGRTGG